MSKEILNKAIKKYLEKTKNKHLSNCGSCILTYDLFLFIIKEGGIGNLVELDYNNRKFDEMTEGPCGRRAFIYNKRFGIKLLAEKQEDGLFHAQCGCCKIKDFYNENKRNIKI